MFPFKKVDAQIRSFICCPTRNTLAIPQQTLQYHFQVSNKANSVNPKVKAMLQNNK